VESDEPRRLAYHLYLEEGATRMTVVQVHPDSASMEFLLVLVRTMTDPDKLLHLADEIADRAEEDEGFVVLAILAAHAALESLVNKLGRDEIRSFNERARFLPKWHDLCERTLGKQLEAAPDLERLHALRDEIAGFSGSPERLDRRSPTPPPELPSELSVETARWAVEAAHRVIDEFRRATRRQRPDSPD